MKNKLLVLITLLNLIFHKEAKSLIPVDSIQYILSHSREDKAYAWQLAEIASQLSDVNPDSAIIVADLTIELSKKLNDNRSWNHALVAKGYAYLAKKKVTEADFIFNAALPRCEKEGDAYESAKLYSGIGASYGLKADFVKDEYYQKKALPLAYESKDKRLTGTILNQTGTIYLTQGKLNLVTKYLIEAAKYFEELYDTSMTSMVYNNLGISFTNLENYPDAVKYLKLALNSARHAQNKKKIINRLVNLGSAYVASGQYDSAKQVLREALTMSEDSSLFAIRKNSLKAFGQLYTKINMYDSALFYLDAGYKIAQINADKPFICAISKELGIVYMKKQNYAAALLKLNESLDIAKELQMVPNQMNCYEVMEQVYAHLNKYDKAYNYLKLFYGIKDSLFNLDKINEADELKTQYETEKKDQQIFLLNADKMLQQSELKRESTVKNFAIAGGTTIFFFSALSFVFYKRNRDADIKKKEAIFNSQVSEVELKALRTQMNPHFIFNSLRSINEFILNRQTQLASEYLIKFSNLMRSILENSRRKEIILSDEINVLELYMQVELQRMEHPFTYAIELDPEIDPENTLIPPMLLQPIIENSIWHGLAPKDKPGKIIIRIRKENNLILCEVEDNGIGTELSRSRRNKSGVKATSYGLKITAERLAIIEQIKKIKTQLTFRDLNGSENLSGLNVSFSLPFAEAI
jgi:tetratricopeptide (TPR) repeat protein